MILRHPWMLLLLLLVPALLYWRYARRRRPSLAFGNGPALARLPVTWGVLVSRALPVLFAIGLLLLIVAIARPQRGLHHSRVRTEAVDIVLLVDVSTSMRAEDFSTPTRRIDRLDAAKEVIRQFILDRPDDRIGLVAFAAMPYTLAPLTLDHAWLLQQMERLKTGMVEDGTAIGDGIASAVNRLRDSQAKSKVVVLLTDGMNNRGALAPLDAARAAEALDIKIYTIGAGQDGRVALPGYTIFGGRQTMHSEIDEPTLRAIADITGGLFFRATDLAGLKDTYKRIDAMEKTEMDVEHYTRYEELFAPFAAWALAFLLAEKLLSLSRFGRLP